MYDGEICKDCGLPAAHGIGVTFWTAPNDLWNYVMGGPNATDDPGGVLCCSCFWRRCRELGIHIAWRAEPVGYRVDPADSEAQPAADVLTPDGNHFTFFGDCEGCRRLRGRVRFLEDAIAELQDVGEAVAVTLVENGLVAASTPAKRPT